MVSVVEVGDIVVIKINPTKIKEWVFKKRAVVIVVDFIKIVTSSAYIEDVARLMQIDWLPY